MFVQSRVTSLVYRLVLVGLVALGVTASLVEDGAGTLRYFTIQSNIVVGCAILYLLVSTPGAAPRDSGAATSRATAILRGLTMLAISLTGIVYHALLAPGLDRPIGLTSHVLHTAVPILFVLDWLIFARKGSFRFRELPYWVVFPLAYLVITLVVARFDGFYPYPFMDAPEIGYGMVAVNAIGLLVGFSALGAVYITIDRLLAKATRRSEERSRVSSRPRVAGNR